MWFTTLRHFFSRRIQIVNINLLLKYLQGIIIKKKVTKDKRTNLSEKVNKNTLKNWVYFEIQDFKGREFKSRIKMLKKKLISFLWSYFGFKYTSKIGSKPIKWLLKMNHTNRLMYSDVCGVFVGKYARYTLSSDITCYKLHYSLRPVIHAIKK